MTNFKPFVDQHLELRSKSYGIDILFVAVDVTHFVQNQHDVLTFQYGWKSSVWKISNKGWSDCFTGCFELKVHFEIVRNQFKPVSFLWLQEVGRVCGGK